MIEAVRVPAISENVESAEVIELLVAVGQMVEAEQPIAELETEKATFELPSPVAGEVVEINVKQGQKIKVGDVVLKVDTEGKGTGKKEEPAVEDEAVAETPAVGLVEEEPPKPRAKGQAGAAGPAVRQLARELGVDISKVKGSGPKGLISEQDVKLYVKRGGVEPETGPDTEAGAGGEVKIEAEILPDFARWGQIEREPMSMIRKRIAETLSRAWMNVPQVTHYDKADITELQEFRAEYGKKVQEAGGKLTITSILLKVAAGALKEFPQFNASLDTEKQEVIYKKYCHIGLAVQTDRGLLVPVIRDVDKKSILQLSIEARDLAEKTRKKKLTADQMSGGSFTVSNLGGIGGTGFSPIVYWPQVAILGVARAEQVVVLVEGQVQSRLVLPLSVSYDHRIIDGANGARFLRKIVEGLEEPFLLALEE